MEGNDSAYLISILLVYVGVILFSLWLFEILDTVIWLFKCKLTRTLEKYYSKKELNYIHNELLDVDGGDIRNNLRERRNELRARLKGKE